MSEFAASPRLSLDAAAHQDLIQQKQKIDALRARLGETKTEQQALREACEGFEAVFIQKMWEQMRKNIPKEGYLHGKDEEMYQSMFDVELSKKMSSAGGIGLADMLYEQLSQKLASTGRTTTPSSFRPPMVAASTYEEARSQQQQLAAQVGPPVPSKLSVESLYSPLVEEDIAQTAGAANSFFEDFGEDTSGETGSRFFGESTKVAGVISLPEEVDAVTAALQSIRNDIEGVEKSTRIHAPMGELTNMVVQNIATSRIAEKTDISSDVSASISGTGKTAAASPPKSPEAPSGEAILAASWHTGKQVSATPKPVSKFSKSKKVQAVASEAVQSAQSTAQGASQSNTLLSGGQWPASGRVIEHFGWQNTQKEGKRAWNPGVTIETPANSQVAACLPGTVVFAGSAEGYDNMVILEHAENYRSYYGNVVLNDVKAGDAVQSGMYFAQTTVPTEEFAEEAKYSPLFFSIKRGEMALNPEIVIPRMVAATR